MENNNKINYRFHIDAIPLGWEGNDGQMEIEADDSRDDTWSEVRARLKIEHEHSNLVVSLTMNQVQDLCEALYVVILRDRGWEVRKTHTSVDFQASLFKPKGGTER